MRKSILIQIHEVSKIIFENVWCVHKLKSIVGQIVRGGGEEQTSRPNRGGVGAPKERLFILGKQIMYKHHTKLSFIQKVNTISVASPFFKPVSM